MIIEFIAWTCAILFALTGIVTILALTKLINIEQEFKRKLFYVLLLEIVGSSIWGYNKYLNEFSSSSEWNFVAITTPEINIANNDVDTIIVDYKYNTMIINGVVQFNKSKNITPKFEYSQNGKVRYETELTINPSGIFNLNIPVNVFSNNSDCKMRAYLEEDGKSIKEYLINGHIKIKNK